MRDFFIHLLSDNRGSPYIETFNIWHFSFLALVIGSIVVLSFLFTNKGKTEKKKLLDIIAAIILGLYFSDFLAHPLLEEANLLIVDKLPFHLCTSVSIVNGFVRLFPNRCEKWRHVPAILGLVGGLFYLAYPTGVAGDSLFCYRTLQTLLYHGLIVIYGVLSITLDDIKIEMKDFFHYPIFISIQIIISIFANHLYSIPDGHTYNWYFSKADPIGVGIDEWIEPFVVLFAISGTVAIIYGIVYFVRALERKSKIGRIPNHLSE